MHNTKRFFSLIFLSTFILGLSLLKNKKDKDDAESVFIVASGRSNLENSDILINRVPQIPESSDVQSVKSTSLYPEICNTNFNYSGDMSYKCSIKIGSGGDFWFGSNDFSLITGPIFINDKMIVADARGFVKAYHLPKDANKSCNFKLAWSRDTSKVKKSSLEYDFENDVVKERSKVKQVSMSYVESMNAILILSFSGLIELVEVDTGKEIWSTKTEYVFRSAPLIDEDKFYAQTSSDDIVSMNLKDGSLNFSSNMNRGKLGSMKKPSPILLDRLVVSGGADGEVFSLDKNLGRPVWSISVGFDDIISRTINDISVNPIKIGERYILAGSIGSGMALFDGITGGVVWKREYSLTSDFSLFGEFVYFIDKENNIVCMHWPTGEIKWHKKVQSEENISASMYFKNRQNPLYKNSAVERNAVTRKIIASGPLMINGNIYVFLHNGKCFVFDSLNGFYVKNVDIPWFVTTRPIVYNENIYFINQRSGKMFVS